MIHRMNEMKAAWLLSLLVAVASCQAPLADEEEEASSGKDYALKVNARSDGGAQISYPAYIYAFAEDGNCVASQKMTANSQIELSVPPAKYTIVAVAGAGEDYVMPENPHIDDVITMKKDNRSSRALMMGSSKVTVSASKSPTVSVTLYYAVALVNVILEGVPSEVEVVKLQMSPLYTALSFRKEYSGKDGSTEAVCQKASDGTWSADPFYIFPGSGTQTVFSITLDDGEKEETYGYTFDGIPEANVPFDVKGSYSGKVSLGGSLVTSDWKDPVEVRFSFATSEEDEGKEDGSGSEETPTLAGLPEVGTVWKDGLVAEAENVTSSGADVLLMSLDEWMSLAADAWDTIEDAEEDGWHLPTETEARTLNAAFGGSAVDEVNETMESLGYDPIDVDKRYLYDNDGEIYAFGFKKTSKFQAAGTTVKYRIRLVRTVRFKPAS